MSESVQCRGCGRRVVLPPGLNLAKARCPKCRTRIEAPPPPAVPLPPDAYEVLHTQSLSLPVVKPPPEVLSLDDALPPDPRPKPRAVVAPPKPATVAAPTGCFPPPFRFAVHVLSDTAKQFRGRFHGVLTPHGLFLELLRDRPQLYAPLGTRCEFNGAVLVVRLPDRALSLRIEGLLEPEHLAADTSAFLARQRPVPLPAEYRRPWWLAGIGALLALGLAAGPIVLARGADLGIGIGLALGAAFALIATLANAGIALFTRLPTGIKIAAMTGVSAAVLGLFLLGATMFLVEEKPPASTPAVESPPAIPPPGTTPSPGPPPVTPPHNDLESHLDLIYRNGKTRLDDGSAAVTALAIAPNDGSAIVGYADGTTRVWPLDQPAFEPPRLGPRASGSVHRIDFDRTGKLAMLSCEAGLVIASIEAPPKTPVVIPGEQVVAWLDPPRERFAALRGGRVQVRFVPMALVKEAPPARSTKGFIATTIKDETLPTGIQPMGLPPPNGGKVTFLAFHPSGRLLCGGMDGSIATLPAAGPTLAPFTSREHKAAVRTWAVSHWGDFATGDDDGFVGYWPAKATTISKFKTGGVAIKGLAFNPCGGELAVVDSSGWVSIWHPATGTKMFEMKQKRAVAAVSYGPREDILMIADGKGVELWWMPELAGQTR